MTALSHQIRYLTRRLAQSPLFTLVSVVTLALGIGATSAIFSVVHGVLLKPLPFDEPERLVGVWHTAPGIGFDRLNQSPALHFTYQDESKVFDEIGMYASSQATVTGVAEPERVPSMRVTDGTLRLLRVRPTLGRLFTAEDDAPGSPETVLLGYAYWQRRFGSCGSARPSAACSPPRTTRPGAPKRFSSATPTGSDASAGSRMSSDRRSPWMGVPARSSASFHKTSVS